MQPRGRSDPGHGSGPPRYPGTFLLAFREAAAQLNWQPRRWLGQLVECLDADGREQVILLENLYRRARRVDRAQWPALIVEFLQSAPAGDQVEGMPTDLAAVADRLLVRVLSCDVQGIPGEAPVWSQDLDDSGLCLSLVVNDGDRMFYVTEQLVADSGRPGSDWLQQALTNLRALTPPNCFQVIHDESGMRSCQVADAYDSSRALLLDTLVPEGCADGWFVAVPGRDHLLVLPVNLEALGCVHVMKVLAEKNFKDTPYAISDEVFWVRNGVWRVFGIQVEGEKVTVQPPEEFLEVLNRLMPEGEMPGPDEVTG